MLEMCINSTLITWNKAAEFKKGRDALSASVRDICSAN